MKSLQTLLKVAQRRLEELGVEAARVQQELDQAEVKRLTILEREKTEVQLGAADPVFAAMLPAYRARIKRQLDEMEHARVGLEVILRDVRVRLQAAYVEKSKFEQLLEQQRLRIREEQAAREQAMLDEVAINRAALPGQ